MTTVRATPPILPQELTELLLDLALSLQRYGMYPGGHPSVDAAVARLAERLDRVLERQPMLSLGVARRQLVVEGVATDSSHPVLRSLAERLHRHRLGAVVFRAGVEAAELKDALRALSVDAERSGEALGAQAPDRLAAWPHVRFYRVTYEQLQLATNESGDEAADEAAVGSGVTSQLWVGLAQAAVAQEPDGASADVDADPDAVARAINDHPAAHAYDQMIVGYLLQLAEELRRDPQGAGAAGVRNRISHMIRSLDPATLQRLLSMGGDSAQRLRFLNDATAALQPDAVLEVVRAAARAQGEAISTSMLRLLRKLSSFADDAEGNASERAEAELRDQVRELLDGWSLDDPNPDQYTRKLELMARESASDAEVAAGSAYGAEPLRIVQMGIEVGATGTTFWRAVDALLAEGRLREIFEIMDVAGAGNPTVDSLWRRLERADHIRRILTTDPVDFDSLERIFVRLPASTVISLLLDRISESASRATRMGVYKRISAMGVAAVPAILERLHDQRWFVVRNMLALLGEIGSWPADFSPLTYARIGHAAVRREALLLATRVPSEREKGICIALLDRDERALRVGIHAAREHGLPASATAIVLQRMNDEAISAEARAALIRLLAGSAAPDLLERLSGLVVQRGLLGRTKVADKTPEMLAALSVLVRSRSSDGRVRAALDLARASTDAEIRAAAGAKA